MSMQATMIPAAVLGGSGYVAGELLRLLALHPRFELVGAFSTSQVGEPVIGAFGHLAGTRFDRLCFESLEALVTKLEPGRSLALFAATPHGATAGLLEPLFVAAEQKGASLRVVDLSADFRFSDPNEYREIYGNEHGAPSRLSQFVCALPELLPTKPALHVAHPGCFTTAVTLAAYPFFARGLVEPEVFVSAVTGSSGSGRKLQQGTHHPDRRSALYAYSPLAHRHEREMRFLLGRASDGPDPLVEFVPHSGPFVRGIHATLRLRLHHPIAAKELVEQARGFYAHSPFVRVGDTLPRLNEVVGTNRCHVGLAVRDRTLVVTSVIDNLVKGAAGGGLQWMNRLFELPEQLGLEQPGLGWF